MLVVSFRLPDNTMRSVGAGALIGRMQRADIMLDDGRVSEAHAIVSLRGRSARLLSLRGRFAVNGKPSTDVELVRGLAVDIAPGLTLEVVDVILPERVLGLRGPAGIQVPVGVTSILPGSPLRIAHGWKPDAAVVLWPVDDEWHTKDGRVEVGSTFDVDGESIQVEWVKSIGTERTHLTGSWSTPLKLITRYDSAHILREGSPTLVLKGLQARFLTELALVGTSIHWRELAAGLWPETQDIDRMRKRWDLHQYRLRRRLREAGVRENLIQAHGNGLVELILGPGDTWNDES